MVIMFRTHIEAESGDSYIFQLFVIWQQKDQSCISGVFSTFIFNNVVSTLSELQIPCENWIRFCIQAMYSRSSGDVRSTS